MFLNRRLLEDASHKTVVVLDRSPTFAQPAEKDVFVTMKDEQGTPITVTLAKNMWSCAIEAVFEYRRVVGDLFPGGSKQLRFVISDFIGRFLSPHWMDKMISHEELLALFSGCDPPQASGDTASCSILNGLSFGIEALSEWTPLQRTTMAAYTDFVRRKGILQQSIPDTSTTTNTFVARACDGNELMMSEFGASTWGETWRRPPTTEDTPATAKANAKFAEVCAKIATREGVGIIGGGGNDENDVSPNGGTHKKRRLNVAEMAPFAAAAKRTRQKSPSDFGGGGGNEDGELQNNSAEQEPPNRFGTPPTKRETERFDDPLNNRGTIVVFTHIKTLKEYEELNEYIEEQIAARNDMIRATAEQIAASSSVMDGASEGGLGEVDPGKTLLETATSLRIHHLRVFIVNVLPKGFPLGGGDTRGGGAVPREATHTGRSFDSRLFSVPASGQPMIDCVQRILASVYDLVCTTVAGIPMKEETQMEDGGSQARKNYDVDLLHPRSAHDALLQHVVETNSQGPLVDPTKTVPNVRLKWLSVTPKLRSDIFPLGLEGWPVTPANPTTRQATCLTTFILNSSKTVMLEVPPEAWQQQQQIRPNLCTPAIAQPKLISHLLARDDPTGLLTIRAVAIGDKAVPRDLVQCHPPTNLFNAKDVNTTALGQLISASMLVPVPTAAKATKTVDNLLTSGDRDFRRDREQEKNQIDNCKALEKSVEMLAQHLSLSLPQSAVCSNLENFAALLNCVGKRVLTDDDVQRFHQALDEAVAVSEADPNGQYRLAFGELHDILADAAHLSPVHRELLTAFCAQTGQSLALPTVPAESAYQHQSPPTKQQQEPVVLTFSDEFNNNTTSVLKPHPSLRRWAPGERWSLLEFLDAEYERKRMSKWRDFEGRIKYGDQAQNFLYPNLQQQQGKQASKVVTE